MIKVYNNININEQSKDNKPTITIVTVVYNGEEVIEETIKSITEQTYKDIEYIIIDGASTDNTLKIVKKYEDHITYWSSERDSGIYDAMNKGIYLANGKWINFMNAGDTYADNDTLSKIIENTKDNNDVIYGDRYYVKNNNKTLQKAKSIDTIFEKMPFGHQSVFIKNEVLKKFKFNDTYKFAADYDLLIQLYMKEYSFQYIPIPICNFISGGQSESGLRPYLEVLKILFDNCKDHKVIEKNFYFDTFRNNCARIINENVDIKKNNEIIKTLKELRSLIKKKDLALELKNKKIEKQSNELDKQSNELDKQSNELDKQSNELDKIKEVINQNVLLKFYFNQKIKDNI